MIFPTNAKELDKTFAAMQAQGKSKAQMQAVYDEYKKRSAASSQSWLGRATQNISETGQNLSEGMQQKLAGVQEQMGSATGLGAPPSNPFNPFPVESSKPDLLDKIGQYGGPVGQMASDMAKTTLGHAEEGLQTMGQGFKAIGQATKTDQLPSNPLTQGQGMSNENLAQVAGGVADVIGGGLSTAFSPLSAVIEKTPVVNTLFEKIGQGQDALSSFLADKIGTTEEEKIALHKSFNNLMNLGVIKYGPKVTEKAAPYVSDAATSLKAAVSDIAGDIKSSPLGKTASGFTNWTSEKLSGMTGKVRGSTESVINSNLDGLTKIENKITPVSEFIADSKAKGIDVKQIVAETDLLKDAVDADGVIHTKQEGGAVSQLKKELKPTNGVVLNALEAEGKTISLADVESYMKSLVEKNPKLYGRTVDAAKASVDAEIKGLAKYADENGNIPLASLQKLKIAKEATVDYDNKETSTIDKDIIRSAKELIEQNTDSIDVKAINGELQRLYTVLEFLDLLNMKRVQGGRLGKYFAQTVGTIVGSPFGALSAIMGGEIAKALYSKSMQGTFKGGTGGKLGLSEQMKSAIDQSSKNEGNLNTNQSTTSMNTTTPIQDTVPPPSGKSNFNTAGTAESASSVKPAEMTPKEVNDALLRFGQKVDNAGGWTDALKQEYKDLVALDEKLNPNPYAGLEGKLKGRTMGDVKRLENFPEKMRPLAEMAQKFKMVQDFIDQVTENRVKTRVEGEMLGQNVKEGDLVPGVTLNDLYNAYKGEKGGWVDLLTDIWNKAHGKFRGTAESASLPKTKDVVKLGEPKTMNALIQEAKKYKSAEEFLNSRSVKTIGTPGGGQRNYFRQKVNLEDLSLNDQNLKLAQENVGVGETSITKMPPVVGLDINTGEMTLFDGYHRFVQANGKGIIDAYIQPTSQGEFLNLTDIWNKAHGK